MCVCVRDSHLDFLRSLGSFAAIPVFCCGTVRSWARFFLRTPKVTYYLARLRRFPLTLEP